MLKRLSLSAFLLMTSLSLFGQELRLPIIFNDHMVLQRDMEVRFWGWGNPGEKVEIVAGKSTADGVVNNDGSWEVFLPKQTAGGPHTISVISEKTISFEDVYFGDVWVAGGQSNMEWKLNWVVENWEEEVKNSDNPEIRFFEVPNTTSYKPETRIPGGEWKIANPDNSPEFSAVAWYFAKLNHSEKGVPVGIVDSNWGGTPAEAWTPAERLLSTPGYEKAASDIVSSDRNWEEEFVNNDRLNELKYQRVNDESDFYSYNAHLFETDDSEWKEIDIPNSNPLTDFVWLRKTFDLESTSDAKLSFGNPGKFTVAFINGNPVYRKVWSDDPKIIDIDKNLLRKGKNVLTVRTVEDWDNRTFFGAENELWIETRDNKISLEGKWKFSNTIEPPMPKAQNYSWMPSFLYNAMIHPIAGYSIKGAIWYQGESNAGAHQYYNVLFESMIEEWRKSWNQGSFPFLFVQLANFMQKKNQPTDTDWARLRESQTQSLSVESTGMATIIDIGDADDIHPRNKHDVGYRLWQAAKKVAYGEDVIYSGPSYRSHKVKGNTIELEFDQVGEGLITKNSEKILGFTIAGDDQKFYWATAVIEGDRVIVSSDKVTSPVAVRYAWADNPDVSLYNKEGLPTVPFRTDNWD